MRNDRSSSKPALQEVNKRPCCTLQRVITKAVMLSLSVHTKCSFCHTFRVSCSIDIDDSRDDDYDEGHDYDHHGNGGGDSEGQTMTMIRL